MKNTAEKKRMLEHWQIIAALMLLYDIVAVNVASFLALWIRFDCNYSQIDPVYIEAFLRYMPIHTLVCVVTLFVARLYNSIWRFASFSELLRTMAATLINSGINGVGITLLFQRMPISYYIFSAGFQFLLLLGIRFSYRFVLLERSKVAKGHGGEKRIMLVGAGNAGQMLLRDAQVSQKQKVTICCIIDDNPNKWGRHIGGVPVVGGRDNILTNVAKYKIDAIFVAVPSASQEDKRQILNICKDSG